jgi:hypothetical protein
VEAYREQLLLEAILSANNLAVGLTCLRRYDFSDKGQFFTGLFAYSIGLERILKLILILDHYHLRGTPPGNDDLRALGHHLDGLLEKAREINLRRALRADASALADDLVVRAVAIVSEFARRSRYYNLDVVTGASTRGGEPLARWDKEVCAEILRRHHRLTTSQKREIEFARKLKDQPGIVVAHTADDGSPIWDMENLALHSVASETKQKYSVFYLHQVVEFCITVLEGLDNLFSMPLYVGEPFRTMSCVPRQMVLRRKIWKSYR